ASLRLCFADLCTTAVFAPYPTAEMRMTSALVRARAGVISLDRTMHVDHERQRGLEVGRRWAQHASAHELASIATPSLDDLNHLLPPDVSDHFVGGFRDAVQHIWRVHSGFRTRVSSQVRATEIP